MSFEHNAAVIPAPKPDIAPSHTNPCWNLAERMTFRFIFVYFILYILPFPVNVIQSLQFDIQEILTGEPPDAAKLLPISKYVLKPYGDFWDDLVLRTGKDLFGIEIEYRPLGSGDTTWNYVQIFDFAVISASFTLLWTLAAWGWRRIGLKSRLGYPHLHAWLRVFVRFYVAQMMIVYGAVKVIKLQFSYPGPDTMLHTFGESSPMHLLWTFMGASDGYTWFTGAGELIAGILLCTRRTTLLGALVTFGVMVHVAALNFCYDVPVKLFSCHLVLMSVFLMAPDLPWLTRVLVLGQPVAARGYTSLVRQRWLDWALFVIRTLVVITFLSVTLYQNNERSKLYGREVPEPPMFGLWEVEEFTLDGKVRPPLTTDEGRWQRVIFRKPLTFQKGTPGKTTVAIYNMRGKQAYVSEVEVNEEEKTISLIRPPGQSQSEEARVMYVLRYTEPEPEVIVLEGELKILADGNNGPKRIKVRLRHYGKDKFLLSSRGFHWINEVPYNRFGPRTEDPPKNPPAPKRP
jgi:uncharacterized membrane protein YphA (DoxX/SURF4 family)